MTLFQLQGLYSAKSDGYMALDCEWAKLQKEEFMAYLKITS
jgi:hypothetical protein